MSAHYLSSARPPHAVIAWVDDVAVYLELPCKDGPPYITKFPLTDNGLHKALNLMRQAYHDAQRPTNGKAKPESTFAPRHPKVKSSKPEYSPEQREAARETLKKLKLI